MTSFVKLLTKLLGVVFVLMGIAGFFVDGYLLIFEVDTVHNIVHLVSGIVALGSSSNYKLARLYLIIFGFVYAAVAIVGFTTGAVAGLFDVNQADNILHAVIGGVSLLVGLGSKRSKN